MRVVNHYFLSLMNNNKTTNILLGILIVVLVAIGIILIKTNSHKNNDESIYADSMSSEEADRFDEFAVPNPKLEDMIGYDGAPLGTPTKKNVDWKSVSSSSVFNLYKKEDISVGTEDKPTLLQEIDLTGDGIPEAIFSASTGNASSSAILFSNSDGSISIAKTKGKDGKIGNVELWEAGMAMYSMSYKLLPGEHGFYTDSRSATNENGNGEVITFGCRTDSVAAYQWNSKTNLFDYNSALTAKYTAIACK